MPGLQAVDLSPIPRQETTLEKTLGSFTSRLRENQIQERESDALRDIYSQYQQDGQNLEKTIQDIQTRPGISPTSRVNTINQLLQFQKHNTELQKKAKQDASNKSKVADLEQRRNLTPGSLAAYEDDPKMAEQVTRPEKQTQASRPIPPDQLRRIQHVVDNPEFETASLPLKHKMLRDAGVSKEYANSELKPYVDEAANSPGKEYGKIREKAVAEYVTNSLQNRESAEETKYALEVAKKAVQGDVAGPGYEAIVKNNPYGQLLTGLTPDEAALQASNKKLLEGSKGIFGSKPTEREIFLLLNSMLPSIGKSKEANLASLYFVDKLNDLKIMHGDLVEEISKQGYVPDIESQVNERMKPMVEEFRKELELGNKAVNEIENKNNPSNKVKVKAPDGSKWEMTQQQIDTAREKGVYFESY